MNLTNIQRDAFWSQDLGSTALSYSVTTAAGATTYNSDGNTYDDVGFAFVRNLQGTVAGGSKGIIGVLMRPPSEDLDEAVAYRVKAYLPIEANYAGVIVGRSDGTISGTNDSMNHWKYFPCPNGKFDEIVMVTPKSNTYPLVFGTLVGPAASVDISSIISVQRLSTAPPKFSSQVS